MISAPSSAEDVSPPRMRLDVSALAIRDDPRAEVRKKSTKFAAQLVYLLIGGVPPVAGVLWIMAHSP
jgi:hypothetical protein